MAKFYFTKTTSHGRYFSWPFMATCAFFIDHFLVLFGKRHFWKLFLLWKYWLSVFIFYWLVLGMLGYVHFVSKKLDNKGLIWSRHGGRRLLWQSLLGLLVPILFLPYLVQAIFWCAGSDFDGSGYMRYEYAIAILLIAIMNVVYYLLWEQHALASLKEEHILADGERPAMEHEQRFSEDNTNAYTRFVQLGKGKHGSLIPLEKVKYIYKKGKNGQLYTVDGEMHRYTQALLKLRPDPRRMMLVNRNYMVNLDSITELRQEKGRCHIRVQGLEEWVLVSEAREPVLKFWLSAAR